MQTVAEYCLTLVQHIEEKQGYPLSSRVREAFLAIPRHAFLSAYYEKHVLHAAPQPEDTAAYAQWLNQIYTDQALTTRQDERGFPLSSSSQPSVMAAMLAVLDVQPGHRVLEIGTGTGYNAALLGYLTGDPKLVTTIERDPELTALAQANIARVVGSGENTITGNGLQGFLPHAPYDRIIATGSTFPVPSSWKEQLAPGGKLVLDLRGRLDGGLMVITPQTASEATGCFLPGPKGIAFMSLRETDEVSAHMEPLERSCRQDHSRSFPGSSEYVCARHFWSYEDFRGVDEAFNLWLQCLFPHLSIKWRERLGVFSALLTENKTRTTLLVEKQEEAMSVAACGPSPLWSDILQAYDQWLALGKPGRECYTLLMTPEAQYMRVSNQKKSHTISLSSPSNT